MLDGTDATGVAGAVRAGDVGRRELVEAVIERIEERDGSINAFVARRFDEALTEADAVDADAPFAGVPLGVKTLGPDVAGMAHSHGSRLFADYVPQHDSELVSRFRRAGFVIVGATNAPEFGKSASTEPLLHGPTHNPYKLSHSAGGSSGGSAAAVAAGMVPIAHANDGGGSTRIPASACSLVGLKPTRGRVPVYPSRSFIAYPFGADHVVTRSVRDSAAVLDAIGGCMPGDPYQVADPLRPYLDEVGTDPGPLTIGLSVTTPAGEPVDPECAAATQRVAATLEDMGHQLVERSPDFPVEELLSLTSSVFGVAARRTIDQRLAQLGRELEDDDIEPFTRFMYDMAENVTGQDLFEGFERLEAVCHRVGDFFTTTDLWLSPTMPVLPPPLGLLDTTSVEAMATHAYRHIAMTNTFNMTGQPAVSLPLGFSADGLPIGVQLVSSFGREDQLFAVGAQLETAMPWSTEPCWPALA